MTMIPLLILAAYAVSHFGLWLYMSRKYPRSAVFDGSRKWTWFAVLMLLPFLGPMLFLTALQNGSRPPPGRPEPRAKQHR